MGFAAEGLEEGGEDAVLGGVAMVLVEVVEEAVCFEGFFVREVDEAEDGREVDEGELGEESAEGPCRA